MLEKKELNHLKNYNSKIMIISRTKAVEIMKNSNGKKLTVTFTKNDGDKRVIHGVVNPEEFMTNLGYIRFIEDGGEHRLINPKTIEKIEEYLLLASNSTMKNEK